MLRADQAAYLARVARLRTDVQRTPSRSPPQRPDLATNGLTLSPAVGDQRRALVCAADTQGGRWTCTGGIDPEGWIARRRACDAASPRTPRAVPAPAPGVVVDQHRRDPEQLVQRRSGRPSGDVIQRRGSSGCRSTPYRPPRPTAAHARVAAMHGRPWIGSCFVMKCQANSNGPSSRRTPVSGGSSLANKPISCSSWPDALSPSSRPNVFSTRGRTRPC